MRLRDARGAMLAVASSCLLSTVGVQAQATPIASPVASGTSLVSIIATAELPKPLDIDGTLVGGLSGIDYNPTTGAWIALSDDRSDNAPARFYTVDLAYDADAIETLDVTSAVTLLQEDGTPYPNADTGGNIPDPESIRFDPQGDTVWYTSEGSYEFDVDPFVAEATMDGAFVSRPSLPEIFEMTSGEQLGPRENLVFEGLTFAADGDSFWVAMEGPLFQDSEPSTFERTSFTRIANLDRQGNVLTEYAVEVDALPAEPTAFATIGVTEILAIDQTRFLIVERGGIETPDSFDNYIKVYEIDITGATDVAAMPALEDQEFTPVTKRLVLDLNATGLETVDNIEGMTWGPNLENGNRTLVLVSDDNFSDTQVSQVIVLEVTGDL